MRYPLTENDPDLRTNLRYKEDVKNVVRLNKNFVPRRRKTYKGTNYTPKKIKTCNGVKGSTPFIKLLPLFDNVWGYPIDYNYALLLTRCCASIMGFVVYSRD